MRSSVIAIALLVACGKDRAAIDKIVAGESVDEVWRHTKGLLQALNKAADASGDDCDRFAAALPALQSDVDSVAKLLRRIDADVTKRTQFEQTYGEQMGDLQIPLWRQYVRCGHLREVAAVRDALKRT